MTPETAPILSTPDTHIFEDPTVPIDVAALPKLTDEQISIRYEIKRTVREIREGDWKRIALQFPDHMLLDAPRVYQQLQRGLAKSRRDTGLDVVQPTNGKAENIVNVIASGLKETRISSGREIVDTETEEKFTILADTSYGACCVDEIAAEHVDADVVVHYGRSCLSPTARLPVIYVYTTRSLDTDAVGAMFESTYPEKDAKIILMADIPYQNHVEELASRLFSVGYSNLFAPLVIHNPSSPLPNRTLPANAEEDSSFLREYSLFHISDPPTSLLLNISSRVASIYIYPTVGETSVAPSATLASTAQMLRRRYALVTRLSTVSVFGILINTLSVKNYLTALSHVQNLISKAGKKAYTFVVGKVNAAKVANFSEVGAWVVIGCWESSLIESDEFWKPIITPFELELTLTDEDSRLWTGEWNSNFQALLGKGDLCQAIDENDDERDRSAKSSERNGAAEHDGDFDSEEESEPPVYDWRTGKYVSQSRPMAKPSSSKAVKGTDTSLIKRANRDLAQVGGEISPAAEFLRSKRTWQGLGSDYEIAYDHDDDRKTGGTQMEEGRSGIARGYNVGKDSTRT